MGRNWNGPLKKSSDYVYTIPKGYKKGMKVDGWIFADDELIKSIRQDNAPEQVANVATLPGVIGASKAMPDIHWGYGFPIGGVAAMDPEEGVISPGGVGYDINCGVRLVKTNLEEEKVRDNIKGLVNTIFDNVPAGVGRKSRLKLDQSELEEALDYGVEWAVENGYGWEQDLERIENNGRLESADSEKVSKKAKDRGSPQLGTLGGGNHFIEIQKVEKIFNEEMADAMDLEEGMITTMIHTGSRGCGHQIATDYINTMEKAIKKYDIDLPDKQLACAPYDSPEGKDYFAAMNCGANYAWTNRQLILHWVRESFEEIFNETAEDMQMEMLYDVCHNVAKKEEHEVDGKDQDVIVHRKGATRAFGPGRKEIPKKYRDVGQPVLIPGDMGTASYVMMGTETSMKRAWGSTCHGAGRVMSRTGARKKFRANQIRKDLSEDGIYVKSASDKVLKEESPGAYKDVNNVVEVTHNAGLSRIVAKLTPIGVMKG
ncbi:MAG: RtcB family protein [Candidatus Thermoplasmatota archaeon]|nr:RtcB family protein [Candidatus Thermoplasmatota archaeon]